MASEKEEHINTTRTPVVAVLALIDTVRIVMMGQYRFAPLQWGWELPRDCGYGEGDARRVAENLLPRGIELRAQVLPMVTRVTPQSEVLSHRDLIYAVEFPNVVPIVAPPKVAHAFDAAVVLAAAGRFGLITDGYTHAALLAAVCQGALPAAILDEASALKYNGVKSALDEPRHV